ncbi:15613_t:CDS:2, partial [Dentiscutata erythropus]
MVRKLKYHEQKLLKKVDFLQWKNEDNIREIKVIRRYHLQKREDYHKYNKLCGLIKKLANRISLLDPRDPFRSKQEAALLDKLCSMGLITAKKQFSQLDKITVSAFCRRRLPIVMCRLKMAETVKEAVTFIEQGHIRVGPETITDPAYLVTRNLEDFVTWVDTSKIKRKIMKYNDKSVASRMLCWHNRSPLHHFYMDSTFKNFYMESFIWLFSAAKFAFFIPKLCVYHWKSADIQNYFCTAKASVSRMLEPDQETTKTNYEVPLRRAITNVEITKKFKANNMKNIDHANSKITEIEPILNNKENMVENFNNYDNYSTRVFEHNYPACYYPSKVRKTQRKEYWIPDGYSVETKIANQILRCETKYILNNK